MQKPANRILSVLLVLVMVLSMLPATVFATGEAESPFQGWSLTLGDNIGVNFYLKEAAENYTVNVTVAGNSAAYDAAKKDGSYVVSVNVAAAQMTDTIALSVADGDQILHTGEYSVRQYAEKILTGEYDNEVKQMVLDLLNYGAAAQNYFNYNVANLANAGYEQTATDVIPTEVPAIDVKDNLSGIALYGMSLLFQNKTAVRFYFHGSGDMNSYTFKVGETAYTPVAKDGQYYVQVDGINPQDLANTIELVVSKDDETLTVSYSPMTYIVRKYNAGGSDSLKALMQAMYNYHCEAKQYVVYQQIIKIDTLVEHPDSNNNWSSGGIYMATQNPNNVPFEPGWSLEFAPTSSSVIKRIRNGETIDVAITGRGTIAMYAADKFYLNINSWTMGDNGTAMDGDIYIIEGDFYNAANDATIRFGKNYIYLNGTNAEFSKEMPTLPTTVQGSAISKHDVNGWASNGVYFKMDANEAPFSGWSVEYTPVASENLKLIRDGETYNIGFPGRGTIVKYNATDYFLKMEWNVGEYAPMKDGDILIVEGGFVNNASKVTLNLPKTYIYANGSNVEFSTEMPTLPTTVQGSAISKHDVNGWASNGVYFKMDANEAPFDGWSVEYTPVASENLKLIRNGETYNIGFPGRGTIVKYNATDYFLKMEWNVGEYAPMKDGDILIVEGGFVNNASKVTLNLPKTYIYANGSNVEFSTEMPTLSTTIEGGVMMKVDGFGWTGGTGSLIFKMDNAAPNGGYAPTSAANVKLIRNGETYDVAYVGQNVINKSNDTWYTLEFWTIVNYKPMLANDILVIEGAFTQNSTKTTLNISKTYVLLNADGSASFSTEMPSLSTMIDAGMMSAHSDKGWKSSAEAAGNLHFAMADNDAPSGYYRPAAASNVKLIRNGVTYDVGHNLRDTIAKENNAQYILEFWTIADHKPMVANDILIIEGEFVQASSNTILNITKTYILLKADGTATFSAEMPSLATIIDAGVMGKHSNGWNADALYFTMAENEAPAADAIRYKPEYASNVKLIRDGVTYDVGHNARETIVKASATGYYIALWTLGDYKPLKANDILIVEGNFTNAANNTTLNISKTYILIKGDGTAVFSTEMPNLGTYVEGGLLIGNDKGWTSDTIYFSMNANEAPYNTDWSLRYKPASSDVIKLLRDGTTTNIANKDAETLVKYSETNCALATWMFGSYGLKAGDILIVEGDFIYAAEDVTLNVQKSYILLNADGSVTVSATEPVPATEVDCGVMSEHADGSASEIYFSMADNIVPVDEELLYPYAGSVQLVKGSNVSNVAANIYKLDADMYYLELDGAELTDGSYLIVEGAFVNEDNGFTMNIQKTYVLAEDDALVYSESAPVLATEYALTGLTNHPNGWNADGIYITHNAHNATIGTGWDVYYRPVSADVIKLVRGGETFNIGQPAGDTLAVYDSAKLYFVTKAWTTQGGKLPFVDGDKIIIEGKFKHEASGDILVAEKTVIYVNGTDLIFNPIEAGNLGNHSNGMNGNGEGIYATMAPNAAPYDSWSVEFTPLTASDYYVIRGGEQINIGMPGRGTLVKYGDTNYYLKMNSWCTNNFAYTTEDIFVVDGFWKHNSSGTIMKMEKTYLYYNGSAWVFSATEPVPSIPGSMMQACSENKWSSTSASAPGNLLFAMDDNTAPSGYYRPTDAANVKLIRNGETYVVGHNLRDTIYKQDNSKYIFEFWTIADYKPMVAGDILIVEGDFYQASSDTTLSIAKTYVLLNADGSASFSDTEPVIKPETNHGMMNVTNWQKPASNPDGSANDGGLYFTMAENDVVYTTDWATQYKPVSADVIKLVRNGVETNVANTAAGMIIKYSATEYYLQFWPITMKPMQAGDIMIVEGQFKNESNGSVLNIAKTYIVFNENGTVNVFENSPMSIDAGTMRAYAVQNWFNTNYNALYFVLDSNIAPAASDWSVRYMPKDAANIKLIRGGNTVNIANTGAETIVKIEDGLYALALDNWWWNAYAPIQDGDVLIIEGEFSNAATGYTLNIDKTYITFVSKANDDVRFAKAVNTEFGDITLPTSDEMVTIGVWNGSHHVFSDARLAELRAAGITKIIGIDPQWIGSENNWDMNYLLDRMQAYGISVVAFARQRTADGTKYSGDAWDGVTKPDYADHPALIGFLMQDEPSSQDFSKLQRLKEQFDAVMPEGKLFYVNLYSESAASTAWYGSISGIYKDYEKDYVDAFITQLNPDVLSWDSYPLLINQGIRTGYFHNFELMAAKNATKWFTLLSSGHNTTSTSYATPTYEELRWQMAVAMTYGVSNLDHYVYTSHESDYSTMLDYNTQTVTDLYYDVMKADNEIKAWDEIYMAYDWQGTAGVKAGTSSTMLDKLEREIDLSKNGLSAVSTNRDLLVGVFDYAGSKAYMVTNAGSAGTTNVGDGKNYIVGDATVTLTLDAADYKCVAVIDNGEISYVAVENNTVTLNVEAYEGVFVIPVLN